MILENLMEHNDCRNVLMGVLYRAPASFDSFDTDVDYIL